MFHLNKRLHRRLRMDPSRVEATGQPLFSHPHASVSEIWVWTVSLGPRVVSDAKQSPAFQWTGIDPDTPNGWSKWPSSASSVHSPFRNASHCSTVRFRSRPCYGYSHPLWSVLALFVGDTRPAMGTYRKQLVPALSFSSSLPQESPTVLHRCSSL